LAKRINRISKSQYVKGLQCPKALWFYRHRPDLAPEISESKQALFDVGNEVGELAKKYFKNGIEITEEYYEITKAIKSTENAVKNGKNVIYEATACSNDGAYSRIDILKKVRASDTWDLIEVKMSTSVQDYHIDDMALQRYAFVGAGYNIRKSILMHINNQYVRSGDIEIKKLFNLEDCTKIINDRLDVVGKNVRELLKLINSDKEPEIEFGSQCYSPFECDYIHHCMKHIPDYSVYNIFRGSKLETLLSDNIIELEDIPDDFDVTERQSIDIEAWKKNKLYKDKHGIKEFLNTLEYPLYFLDYETIYPALPLYDNSRPYQQIPFQYSLHIQKKRGGSLQHIEFLYTDEDDPRPSFIMSLIENCGKKGSVVVYNQSFENRINRELSLDFPRHKAALKSISDRMIDLLVPFRSRLLYHPEMKGSASLKAVLPAFVPRMSYDKLEIQDGGMASILYMSCMRGMVTEDEKQKIYGDLKDYCCQDTLAEAKLLEVLYKNG